LVPAANGGDDFLGVSGPNEGLWHLICLVDEAIDRGLELDNGSEDTALQAFPGKLGEVAFHGVEPRT
jgi:hypothetical protein